MTTELVTAPASEPVSTAEAKTHLRQGISDDDNYIAALIVAARLYCEEYTQRAFVDQTWRVKLDDFPASESESICLPRPPLSSVTSVQYVDTDGDSQTWDAANYTADTDAFKGRVYTVYNGDWPDTQDHKQVVTITYVAGFGAASDVPETIKAAIKLHVELLYDRPAGNDLVALETTRDALLAPYRVVEA